MTKKTTAAFTEESRMKDQARKLHKALVALNPELTYAQTLEALARSQGNRTLHVYKAQKPVVVESTPLMDTARRMATRMFFQELGDWQGKAPELLHELSESFVQADERGGRRYVERRVHELCNGVRPVTVKPAYDHLAHESWKDAFYCLVAELAQELAAEANLKPQDCEPTTLFKGLVRDWRVDEGDLGLDDADAAPFEATVSRNATGNQFYVDIIRPDKDVDALEGTPQLSLFIEVNQGLPCVHMTNDAFGDQVLTVFFTEDGLYLRPDSDMHSILSGVPVENTALAALHAKEMVPFKTYKNSFIPNKV